MLTFIAPSQTETLIKYLKSQSISVDSFLPRDEHPQYAVNKHFQWLGPTIFIPIALLSENPHIVSLAIGVISNCISDFFKGIPKRKRHVQLSVIVEKEGKRVYKKITYEGNIEGLSSFPKVIREASK